MKITSITIHTKSQYAFVEYGSNPVMRRARNGRLIDFDSEELAFIQRNSNDLSKVQFIND